MSEKLNDEQIAHMVQRFLAWKLPEDFQPDGGVQFDPDGAKKLDARNLRYEPYGTNLLDARQAEAMVRYITAGMPAPADQNAIGAAEAETALAWLAADRRLSLEFHGPVYGDDDDDAEEWRVYRESGNINDREWDQVGAGGTPLAALLAAMQAEAAAP